MDIATLGIHVDNSQVRQAGAEINRLGDIGKSVGKQIAHAFGALAGVFAVHAVIHKFAEETINAQNAMAQLENAVESTGGIAGRTAAQLDELSKRIQSVTTFSDEAAKGALTMLLVFDKVRGDTLERAAFAAANLAARMGGDLPSAAQTVGKALQDTEHGVALLNRQFRIFDESQVAALKHLQDTGHLAEAQTIILDKLATKFGGAAEAARNTLGGALRGLANDFGDLFEISTGGTASLVSGINAVGAALRSMQENADTVIRVLLSLAGVLAGNWIASAAAGLGVYVAGIGLARAATEAWAIENARNAAMLEAQILTERAALVVEKARLEAIIAGGTVTRSLRGSLLATNLALEGSEVSLAAAQVGVAETQIALATTTARLGVVNTAVAATMGTLATAARAAWTAIGGWIGLAIAAAVAFYVWQDKILQKLGLLSKATGEQTAAESAATEKALAAGKARAAQKQADIDAANAHTKEALDFIKSMKQEADTYGLSTAEARLYTIAISDLTEAEKALARVQANRLTVKETQAALAARELQDNQTLAESAVAAGEAQVASQRAVEDANSARVQADNEVSVALYDQVAAMNIETEILLRQAAVLNKNKKVRDALQVTLAGEQAVREALNRATAAGTQLTEEEIRRTREAAEARERASKAATITPAQDALETAKALSVTINEAVGGTLQLADAFGAVDASTAKLLTTITQVATAANTMAAAIKAGATGDAFSAGLSIVGGIASLFGGGGGRNPAEKERADLQRKNNEAIERLTKVMGELGLNISGSDFVKAQQAITQLLATPASPIAEAAQRSVLNRGGTLFGMSLSDLQDLADQLHTTFDVNNLRLSLDALDKALKATQLTQFAETFAGQMQALNAQFAIFNTTDPLAKLIEQLRVAGDIGSITHDPQGRLIRTAGVGSSAINAAGAGLDLATTVGRDQLTANLQALFKQLQAGTLAAGALGGLTAQEFLDQLTGLIDLVRQAEDAARARTRGLQDLEVRRLRATRQDTAADDLAFALSQQREYEDAVLSGADALTLATLQEVQRAEALFRSTEAMQGAIDTLQKFSDSLKLDTTLTTLSPAQQLTEAKRQYDVILAAAQGGDAKAAQQLPEAARAFLQASRAVNASGPAYAADFARVVGETDALRQMFQDQKDIQQLIYDVNTATAEHTATLVEVGRDGNAILSEGFGLLVTKQDAMQAQIDELIRQTKIGNEGGLA